MLCKISTQNNCHILRILLSLRVIRAKYLHCTFPESINNNLDCTDWLLGNIYSVDMTHSIQRHADEVRNIRYIYSSNISLVLEILPQERPQLKSYTPPSPTTRTSHSPSDPRLAPHLHQFPKPAAKNSFHRQGNAAFRSHSANRSRQSLLSTFA